MSELPKLIDLPAECFAKRATCSICGKTFMHAGALRDHRRGAHPGALSNKQKKKKPYYKPSSGKIVAWRAGEKK